MFISLNVWLAIGGMMQNVDAVSQKTLGLQNSVSSRQSDLVIKVDKALFFVINCYKIYLAFSVTFIVIAVKILIIVK